MFNLSTQFCFSMIDDRKDMVSEDSLFVKIRNRFTLATSSLFSHLSAVHPHNKKFLDGNKVKNLALELNLDLTSFNTRLLMTGNLKILIYFITFVYYNMHFRICLI